MAITTTTAETVLKSYYLDAVTDQLDKSVNPLLSRIAKTTSDIWGKDVRKIVRYGVNGGIGAGTEDGDLPQANPNRYAMFIAPLKNLFGSIEISDKAIRASANGEGAFVDLLNAEMDELVKSSAFNLDRMLFGDGTGKLATIASGTGKKYVVDSVKNLSEGMVVDIYDAGGSRVATADVIDTLDRAAKTVTLRNSSISSPADHVIYVQGSKGLELTGLGALFSETPVYGVERAGVNWMTPYIKKETGDLTELEIQKAIDKVDEVAGSKINFIVCSWGVRRALFDILSKYRTTETIALEGGFSALNFNGIPVVADRFCPDGTMYLLNTDDFGLHQLCDWQWLEGEDGKILKQLPGKAVYTATLVKYAELLCYRPCGQAMLTGITEK